MWVYPRVGGGNGWIRKRRARWSGLSPRGRGKPTRVFHPQLSVRSIPAWAGETQAEPPQTIVLGVYPRVGGGNATSVQQLTSAQGLSPRGRGKLQLAVPQVHHPGSIPAWAGETK